MSSPCICYLDYDGVLHNDAVYNVRGQGIVCRGGALFEWSRYLVEALEHYPGVRIVLSTSWVRELGYSRARSYLPTLLKVRCVGATFHRREHGPTRDLRWLWAQSPRGQQIQDDIRRRQPPKWFAIDDAVNEFSASQREWLVPCVSAAGLSDVGARAVLREMLKKVAP